ncbi:hypothetical protein BC828DRAFT_374917 [Blastocladiella britannica]|nr:hypothetical protein BC828DRAFT_374917 [Blastocladiella britannica]
MASCRMESARRRCLAVALATAASAPNPAAIRLDSAASSPGLFPTRGVAAFALVPAVLGSAGRLLGCPARGPAVPVARGAAGTSRKNSAVAASRRFRRRSLPSRSSSAVSRSGSAYPSEPLSSPRSWSFPAAGVIESWGATQQHRWAESGLEGSRRRGGRSRGACRRSRHRCGPRSPSSLDPSSATATEAWIEVMIFFARRTFAGNSAVPVVLSSLARLSNSDSRLSRGYPLPRLFLVPGGREKATAGVARIETKTVGERRENQSVFIPRA